MPNPSRSYRSFCIAVDMGLTVGLTDLFLSHIIISSAILSSAHCAVSRASASWSQQSSIVSLSDLTAYNKVHVKQYIFTKKKGIEIFSDMRWKKNQFSLTNILHSYNKIFWTSEICKGSYFPKDEEQVSKARFTLTSKELAKNVSSCKKLHGSSRSQVYAIVHCYFNQQLLILLQKWVLSLMEFW